MYFGQADAVFECLVAQLGDAWRYSHLMQRLASFKCAFSDDLRRTLVELHFDQVDASLERSVRNILDLWADADACNFTPELPCYLTPYVEEDFIVQLLEDTLAFASTRVAVHHARLCSRGGAVTIPDSATLSQHDLLYGSKVPHAKRRGKATKVVKRGHGDEKAAISPAGQRASASRNSTRPGASPLKTSLKTRRWPVFCIPNFKCSSGTCRADPRRKTTCGEDATLCEGGHATRHGAAVPTKEMIRQPPSAKLDRGETDNEKSLKRSQAWDTFDTESTAGLSVIEEEQSREDMGTVVPPKTGAREDTPSTARNCSSLLDDDDDEEDEEIEANSIDSSPKMQRKRVHFDTPSPRSVHCRQKSPMAQESASSPPRIIRTHGFLPSMIGKINSTRQQSPQSRGTSIRSQPGMEVASQVVEPLSCREKIEQPALACDQERLTHILDAILCCRPNVNVNLEEKEARKTTNQD
ncbi:hypothetical protein THAOC_35713 [Thalassiosira oceanica]|uniref:Uncharacterized protein n=1 Tax=Thalassiosira oceanica TaxID=159749 RepID=K0R1B6_THAOC|nr:hypothetical protein THAOC_35713 [Thalassiosira oceanica]|eukprot:EJK45665.1 hypothetical protein THAOC_35713 [Thalassiosira oceanica]